MTADTIKKWLKSQTSYDYAPKGEIKVMEDPKVFDTWAVRFEDVEMGQTDLMFVCGNEEGTHEEILERCLEEVEYDHWPPHSSSLKFFH